jgi:hypothetical protein
MRGRGQKFITFWHEILKKKSKVAAVLDNEALRHEDIWESGGIFPPFLTAALDGDDWSV